MKIFSAYDPPPSKARKIVGKTMTKQNLKDECDINKILARFQKDGALTHVRDRLGEYGDFTGTDFKTAMDLITNAQELFNDLPSSVRDFFANDPSRFFDYVNDPENEEEVRSGFSSITQPRERSASPTGESDADGDQNTGRIDESRPGDSS